MTKFKKEIGAIWKRKTREGDRVFWSGVLDLGVLGTVQVVAFANTEKKTENQPDIRMYLSEPLAKSEKTDTRATDTPTPEDVPSFNE